MQCAPSHYPGPSEASLKLQYVGKQINDVEPPAAIIDAAVVRRNCKLMLDTADKLGLGFRAHVKTHKTRQIAELQVGKGAQSVKLVASTVGEIENLMPWLRECVQHGKQVNILYGLPLLKSSIPRLAAVVRILGEGSVGLFVDHPSHIDLLERVDEAIWPGKIPVFVNVDVGYHREGVTATSEQLLDIARRQGATTRTTLAGFYTHMGHSYGVSSPDEALEYMSRELEGVAVGARAFLRCLNSSGRHDPITAKPVLSLGATPTATSTQNLFDDSKAAQQYRAVIERAKEGFEVELHAGVYPVMDMQQLATRARPPHTADDPSHTMLSFSDLGLRILVEVASVYPGRGEKPEALVAAGCIALGREPCKSYPGWGVVSPWPSSIHSAEPFYDPERGRTGWIVGRVSQEHGILTWEGSQEHMRVLDVGEKLMLWPNHACIAGVSFGWYLVVDSDLGDPDQIQDVWVRWRGW